MDGDDVTWFAATSGRVTGILGLLAGAVAVVTGIVDGAPVGVVAGLLVALLCWMVLLRPRVGTRGSELLLRGMASTVIIPLASIESLVMRQVLAVSVNGRRYVSAAVGRKLRQMTRRPRSPLPGPEPHVPEVSYADVVHDQLTERAHVARRDGAPNGPVRREWAWPELGALGVLLVALVVTLLV